MNGQNLTVLTSHDVSGIFKVQNDNGSIFKAAINSRGVESSRNRISHCSWRPQSSEKVEKPEDIIKRHLHKLTQETQDNWFKVLPITLMRAQTAHKKKGLSMTDCFCSQILS